MKKIAALLLCIVTLISFTACSYVNIENSGETEPSDNNSEIKKPMPKEVGVLDEKMNIELFCEDNISVYATAFYKESDGDWVMECDITNDSKDDVFVALEYPEINGICSPIPLWADAKRKSSTTGYLYIYSDFLELAGITTITEIAARFNVYNEYYRPLGGEYISFTLGADDYEQIINTEGTKIIDEENVQVIIQDKRIGKEGTEVVVCYINNNDYTVKFDITDVMIDSESFPVEAPFELPEYSMTVTTFCIYDSDMIYAGIDSSSISEMSITAKAVDVIGDSVAECENAKVVF
ncbi:MAG: hypothetical protein IKU52_00085 [Clostridia bacterium]|nr:hypothetical protein [Clostridia bacterium]